MRIINETNWETKGLRKIFAACLAEIRKTETHPCTGRLKVKVVWHKTYWVGGRAGINNTWMTMKLPRLSTSRTFPQDVAKIFIHELGHCLGIDRHRRCKTIEHLYDDWIKANITTTDYPLTLVEESKPKKSNTSDKLESALKNKKKAETRMKRAKTLLWKWTRKVKYYEQKLAKEATKSVTVDTNSFEKTQ